jgi:hypothetical protein
MNTSHKPSVKKLQNCSSSVKAIRHDVAIHSTGPLRPLTHETKNHAAPLQIVGICRSATRMLWRLHLQAGYRRQLSQRPCCLRALTVLSDTALPAGPWLLPFWHFSLQQWYRDLSSMPRRKAAGHWRLSNALVLWLAKKSGTKRKPVVSLQAPTADGGRSRCHLPLLVTAPGS